jgi:hypothetical protein
MWLIRVYVQFRLGFGLCQLPGTFFDPSLQLL